MQIRLCTYVYIPPHPPLLATDRILIVIIIFPCDIAIIFHCTKWQYTILNTVKNFGELYMLLVLVSIKSLLSDCDTLVLLKV